VIALRLSISNQGENMDTAKFTEILKKHIDEKGLAKDLAIELMLPFLEKFVKDTANPYDDQLVSWFKTYVEKNL
jgi:hypothetical protein